jgi:glycosyltransferase involved in cell wall biosynthesis
MKPRVLLITSIYPPQVGGPAIFTSRYSKWLSNQNIENRVITYNIRKEKSTKDKIFVNLYPVRVLSFFTFIHKIIRNSSRETLILSNGAFIETYIACRITGRKYIAKIPGDPVWELSRNRKWTLLSRKDFQFAKLNFVQLILRLAFNSSFKNAKYFIAPSNELAVFAKNWGLPEKKIKLIFNCVDPNKFKSVEKKQKKYDLITVARLVEGKGIKELIECAAYLNLKLVIVGDGPLFNELHNFSLNLGAQIDFVGNLSNDNVVGLLNDSRIFVLNSDSEATSYALIEAKMCELPILAKRNDGSLTIVRHKIDGLIYSSELNDTLLESIKILVADSNLILDFGNAGREDALTRFNQELNFNQILELLVS